jgi:hypothetical protein
MGETNFGVLDLTVASFVAQVMADFPNVGNTGCGNRMTF